MPNLSGMRQKTLYLIKRKTLREVFMRFSSDYFAKVLRIMRENDIHTFEVSAGNRGGNVEFITFEASNGSEIELTLDLEKQREKITSKIIVEKSYD
jgi:hypothetical protein